jgi:hypothetical protein
VGDGYYEDLSVGQIHDRGQIINLNAYWRDKRKEYSGGKLVFFGTHHRHNASEDDTDWEIWKYTYDGDDLVREEGPLPGSWNGRAALDWNENVSAYSQTVTTGQSNNELLEMILRQLKIINSQLSLLTNTEIEDGELE